MAGAKSMLHQRIGRPNEWTNLPQIRRRMTTLKQIEANRRNALKSTGPVTDDGKRRSRCNAIRHGLTAETVIAVLEDPEDYKAFERSIMADFDAQTAVERELVLRLASLMWRLRRATAIETGLLEIADGLDEAGSVKELQRYDPDGNADPAHDSRVQTLLCLPSEGVDRCFAQRGREKTLAGKPATTNSQIAGRFLAVATLNDRALGRLNRYESLLWRQVGQIFFVLSDLRLPYATKSRGSWLRRWREPERFSRGEPAYR